MHFRVLSLAALALAVAAPIAGIHLDAGGRVFASTPRLLASDLPATLSVLDTSVTAGPVRLTAFPSLSANALDGAPSTRLRSVLGFHVDRRNGWLWALDQGFVAGETEAPAGAQKIAVFDLRDGRLVKTIALDAVADRKGSFLNDIAVDEARRVAYVSDSGLRSAPDNQAGLIVATFDDASARRVLHRDRCKLSPAGCARRRALAGHGSHRARRHARLHGQQPESAFRGAGASGSRAL